MRNESVRENKMKVDKALTQKGLMPRIEKFLDSEEAKNAVEKQFNQNLQAMREKTNSLPECYSLYVALAYDAKCSEQEEFTETVHAIFKFNLNKRIDMLAQDFPIDKVVEVLNDETQYLEKWMEGLQIACNHVSDFVMFDFCKKVLALCLPASMNRVTLKILVETLTGKKISESEVNQLWYTCVIRGDGSFH